MERFAAALAASFFLGIILGKFSRPAERPVRGGHITLFWPKETPRGR
jgi:hypothetical protein